MSHKTNPFQKLIKNIISVYHEPDFDVQESVEEKDSVSGEIREVDIRITKTSLPYDKVFIECRYASNVKNRQNIEWIDQIAGKYEAIDHKKIIAVSNTGFTKGALKQALSKNIETLTLIEAEKDDWKGLFKLDSINLELNTIPQIKSVIFKDLDNNKTVYTIENALENILLIDSENTLVVFRDWLNRLWRDKNILQAMTYDCKLHKEIELEYSFLMNTWKYKVKNGSIHKLQEIALIIMYGIEKINVPLKTNHLGKLQSKTGEFLRGSRKREITITEKDNELVVLLNDKM